MADSALSAAEDSDVALGVDSAGDSGEAFMATASTVSAAIPAIYFLIVMPYRAIQRRRGVTAFGDPPPVKTCPACLAEDIPAAASKCRYCGTEQPAVAAS